MSKGTFILYDIDLESLEFLSKEQVGELFTGLAQYRLKDIQPEFGNDGALKIIFHQITEHIRLNEEKYQSVCKRNSESAKKRWANKKNACECEGIQADTKRCLYDTDNDTDNVTDTVTETDTVACGAKKKTKENNHYNKKNNIPKLLQDDPAYDIEAFERKAIGLKYQKKDNATI